MTKAVFLKTVSVTLAAAAIALAAVGCSSDSGSSGSSSKGLEANLEYAKAKVADYSHNQKRSATLFADEIYSKANAAAMMIDGEATDEDFEKTVRCLYLDGITVADENRKVVASCPKGEEGKSLKELGDKKIFTNVVSNISYKQMTDPVYDESTGLYSVMASVKRSDGTGAVIIELSTDEYADVCGANLAEKCGNNTVIIKDGAVLSSTLSGVNPADDPEKLGITDADSFTLTVEGKEYQCMSTKAGSKMEGLFTVVCAEPK